MPQNKVNSPVFVYNNYHLSLKHQYLLYSHLVILFIIALQVCSNDSYTNSDMFTLGQVFYSLLVSSNTEQFYGSDVCRPEDQVSDQPLPLAISLRYILHQMMTETAIHKLTAREAKQRYCSNTCVKRPLSNRPEICFQDHLSLNAGQRYCRMLPLEHSAILLTFINLPFVIKIFVLSIFKWLFYMGFTVFCYIVQKRYSIKLGFRVKSRYIENIQMFLLNMSFI